MELTSILFQVLNQVPNWRLPRPSGTFFKPSSPPLSAPATTPLLRLRQTQRVAWEIVL